LTLKILDKILDDMIDLLWEIKCSLKTEEIPIQYIIIRNSSGKKVALRKTTDIIGFSDET
jgi:hypothetical protein